MPLCPWVCGNRFHAPDLRFVGCGFALPTGRMLRTCERGVRVRNLRREIQLQVLPGCRASRQECAAAWNGVTSTSRNAIEWRRTAPTASWRRDRWRVERHARAGRLPAEHGITWRQMRALQRDLPAADGREFSGTSVRGDRREAGVQTAWGRHERVLLPGLRQAVSTSLVRSPSLCARACPTRPAAQRPPPAST